MIKKLCHQSFYYGTTDESDFEPGSCVTLEVGRGKTSQMAGQHRENFRRLTEEFSLAEVKIKEKLEADTEVILHII